MTKKRKQGEECYNCISSSHVGFRESSKIIIFKCYKEKFRHGFVKSSWWCDEYEKNKSKLF